MDISNQLQALGMRKKLNNVLQEKIDSKNLDWEIQMMWIWFTDFTRFQYVHKQWRIAHKPFSGVSHKV